MVGVHFEEALGDDQGDKHQGDERLGDSFSGGGFHYGAQPRINRFPCQAWRADLSENPMFSGLKSWCENVGLCHAEGRVSCTKRLTSELGQEGGEERNDPLCRAAYVAWSHGAQLQT